MNYLKETEWCDLRVAIDGKQVLGIINFEYTKKWDDEHIYGSGNEPIGIQSGNKTYTGIVTLYKNELDALNTAAKALGYDDISDVQGLVFTAAYLPKGGRVLKTDTMTGCKISELSKKFAQGDKVMKIDLPYLFLGLKSA